MFDYYLFFVFQRYKKYFEVHSYSIISSVVFYSIQNELSLGMNYSNLSNPISGKENNRFKKKRVCIFCSHVPELLKTFQDLINQREPGDLIIPKNIYDQNDTDSMISIGNVSCDKNFVYLNPFCFRLRYMFTIRNQLSFSSTFLHSTGMHWSNAIMSWSSQWSLCFIPDVYGWIIIGCIEKKCLWRTYV